MRTIAANLPQGISNRHECTLVRIGVTFLAVIFIVAGINKWIALEDFEVSLIRWEIFPDWMIWPIVAGVSILEIVLGLMCLVGGATRQALEGLLVLTAVYTLLLWGLWMHGTAIECECFGSQSAHLPNWALLLRNVGLLLFESFLIRRTALQHAPEISTTPALQGELQ